MGCGNSSGADTKKKNTETKKNKKVNAFKVKLTKEDGDATLEPVGVVSQPAACHLNSNMSPRSHAVLLQHNTTVLSLASADTGAADWVNSFNKGEVNRRNTTPMFLHRAPPGGDSFSAASQSMHHLVGLDDDFMQQTLSFKRKSHQLDKKQLTLLQKFPQMWTDPEFYNNHMDEMWDHYDPKGYGYLKPAAITQLTKDTVKRFLELYRQQLSDENAESTIAEIDSLVEKNIPLLLPGERLGEIHANLGNLLLERLNVARDGKIHKAEFMEGWVEAHTTLFEMKDEHHKREANGGDCVLM